MPHPLHHASKRKRIHQKNERYPHPDAFKRFMDHAIYVVGILGPVFAGLQSHKIWTEQTAAGVSLITFAWLAIGNLFWVVYGILHKEKPIIIMYVLFFIVNSSIVAGVLRYG